MLNGPNRTLSPTSAPAAIVNQEADPRRCLLGKRDRSRSWLIFVSAFALLGAAAAGSWAYWESHRGWTVERVRQLVDDTFDPKWSEEEAEIWISRWSLASVRSDVRRYSDGKMDGRFIDIKNELEGRPGI